MSEFLDARYEALVPYTPGEQPRQGGLLKLNTNENPYPPSPEVARRVAEAAGRLHLYSDTAARVVCEPLARQLGVQPENVTVGNGSDELLAFCFQGLCPNGAAFADLTYGFYPVYCQLYGVDVKVLPLREDFSLDVSAYEGLGRTIFIANPNAPTGLALSPPELRRILDTNPGSLVVVDEAYVDFGAQSAVRLLEACPNLLVVGTFSKSRQLAGARLGYAVASRALIEDINRLRFSFNPYNVNSMTQAAGAGALADTAYYGDCIRRVVQARDYAQQALQKLGFTCTDSKANFLFAAHPEVPGEFLFSRLRERDILVRWFNRPRIQNHLRISVGTQAQMERLVQTLREILREYKSGGNPPA